MQCPRDESKLVPVESEGLKLNACTTCQGMWFDSGELRQAKDQAAPDLDWLDFEIWKHEDEFEVKAHPRRCPACDKGMVSLTYGTTRVVIDTCPVCHGTWLDEGEFERLIEALYDEAGAKSMKDYLKRVLSEGLEVIKRPGHIAEEWNDFKHVLNFMKARLHVERPNLARAIESAQKSTPF